MEVIQNWNNPILNIENLFVINLNEEFYFKGKRIAEVFGYERHIDNEDKITFKELKMNLPETGSFIFGQSIKDSEIFVNEFAVYALALKSKLPSVRLFQRWVYNTIKNIRISGGYSFPNFQNLSLEETPVEKIRSTIPEIPSYDFSEENIERKEMHDSYKEGFEESKDEKSVIHGACGGSKTQSNIRELKRFVRNAHSESKEIEDEDNDSKIEFFNIIKKESKEIVEKQKL